MSNSTPSTVATARKMPTHHFNFVDLPNGRHGGIDFPVRPTPEDCDVLIDTLKQLRTFFAESREDAPREVSPVSREIAPSLSARPIAVANEPGWLELSLFIPVPIDAPADAMFLAAWARIEGKRLVEWRTTPPSQDTASESGEPCPRCGAPEIMGQVICSRIWTCSSYLNKRGELVQSSDCLVESLKAENDALRLKTGQLHCASRGGAT